MLRKLLLEPLVHFSFLGLLLFAANALFSKSETSSTRIVVTPSTKEELARGYTEANGRAPSAAELDELLARWIDDEVLYREGVARGIDRDDALVRKRVAAKMGFILESKVIVREPTQAELEQWFDAHSDRWQKAELVDFVHVFVEGSEEVLARARAAEILERLDAGADPNGLGDRFSGGRQYRARKLDDLKKSFGDDFVVGMSEQPIGKWMLRRSRFGFHLVRIERRTAARGADLASVKLEVEKDWKDARRASEVVRIREELKRRYRIERKP